MTAFPPRFFVTPEQIDAQVAAFYAAVRAHPVLGPVFAGHVDDWPAHEAKIGRFWRNAILREGVYDGSPMMAHRQAGDVRSEHFPLWLDLFDSVLQSHLPRSRHHMVPYGASHRAGAGHGCDRSAAAFRRRPGVLNGRTGRSARG